MSFLTIKRRENFLVGEIPPMHPASIAYRKFWMLHRKRCHEGFWSQDTQDVRINAAKPMTEGELAAPDDWRWMPPNLYFYSNFGTIELNPESDDETAPKIKARPHLRDFEWEFHYNWAECRGFSGFEDDEEFSCDIRIKKFLKAKKNNNSKKAERIRKRMRKNCFKADGTLKEFVPAREYIRQTFNKPMGQACWTNEAKNLMLLGARGGGKSYLVGVSIILWEFLFDGVRRFNMDYVKNPPRAQICIGAGMASKSAEILEKFVIGLENLPGEYGVGTKHFKPSPFYRQTSGSLKSNNGDNVFQHLYQKKQKSGGHKKVGSKTSLKHVTYTTENPEAAAGGRYTVMAVEEVGLLPNVLTVHGSNDACQMKDGTVKFGSSVYIGTGGNVEKIQETEIIFRDPAGFNFLEFENEWEGGKGIGWFVPAYYMDGNYKDEQGNTDVEAAIESYEERRDEKAQAADGSALANEMMNYPLVPSEMFLNTRGAMFPQVMLKAQLEDVISNPQRYLNAHYHIELYFDNQGKIKYDHVSANRLETEWPVTSNKDRPGVVECYELPKKNSNGEVQQGRYLQGTDTYDDDESVTSSLGSTWIIDTFTDRLVAEFTGRRGSKEFYEITRLLNIFYRTTHNYEQNKKGLYSYYDQKNCSHLLCDTPESLKDVADITISKIGNKRKGTVASTPVNAYGLRLILDWLLKPAYGEDVNSEILNLHTIKSPGLLRELINYNKDGNFDRVSALIMLMIIREDRLKYATRRQEKKVESLSNDDFFKRNYTNENSFI